MDLIFAMDVKSGLVVHGERGMRETYRPLDWGLSRDPEPRAYLRELRPRHLYIADLDRIMGISPHGYPVSTLLPWDGLLLLDRGARSPDDLRCPPGITPVIGTETAGPNLAAYKGGYLSIDIRDGHVLPRGDAPETFLRSAACWDFEAVILLAISAVGTGGGVPPPGTLDRYRASYPSRLLWGGGVRDTSDLSLLEEAGFDGAIVCTGVHSGKIPVVWIRRGATC